MKRPKFGQWIRAKDRAIRVSEPVRSGMFSSSYWYEKKWVRHGEKWPNVIDPKPIEGLYIGYRTCYDGKAEYSEEDGWAFFPEKKKELWRVVPGPRQNPVYVFPEDVEPWEEADRGQD